MDCPECNKPLRIEWRDTFIPNKPATYSLAGVQLKFSATRERRPWAVCDCGWQTVGKRDCNE